MTGADAESGVGIVAFDEVAMAASMAGSSMGLSECCRLFRPGRSEPTPLVSDPKISHWKASPEELVLDSFLGSGTTALAAQRCGGHGLGIEQQPHFCRNAEERLRRYRRCSSGPYRA